ncbi:hypothetical protein OUZ56_008045 [Daphnia magna]|uniref:Uncharacterized protein n=1 Tax=Daphnia magna TaxID=35525 RepID=A0ABR0ABS4_9CRUS|nr:hypothetical protein OUZ56_008045 [Daphnia magna]
MAPVLVLAFSFSGVFENAVRSTAKAAAQEKLKSSILQLEVALLILGAVLLILPSRQKTTTLTKKRKKDKINLDVPYHHKKC